MSENCRENDRRTVLKAAAGLAISQVAIHASNGLAMESVTQHEKGKPGDFDFLAGEWTILNRRLKDPQKKEWDEFEGEATCWTILGGIGSIEELRIPARNFSGMGLRLLDVEKQIWNDFWVNSKSGELTTPGQTGVFEKGVGTFAADDSEGGKPIKVKGVWDQITPDSCRWYQATSTDNGTTWQENWIMKWSRVKKKS